MENQKKYRIDELMQSLTIEGYSQALIDLTNQLKLSRSQLNRIRALTIDQKSSATTDQLLIIAHYFDVPIEELITEEYKEMSRAELESSVAAE